jgi:hypothetical protein
MKLALFWAAFVGIFGWGWYRLGAAMLAEAEEERRDLARDASPCTQPLGRYQP